MDATMFKAWMAEAARLVVENADHLTHLDAAPARAPADELVSAEARKVDCNGCAKDTLTVRPKTSTPVMSHFLSR